MNLNQIQYKIKMATSIINTEEKRMNMKFSKRKDKNTILNIKKINKDNVFLKKIIL